MLPAAIRVTSWGALAMAVRPYSDELPGRWSRQAFLLERVSPSASRDQVIDDSVDLRI